MVERILAGLKSCSCLVVSTEHGLLNGRNPPRSTQPQRSTVLGLSKRQYRSRPVAVRTRVGVQLARECKMSIRQAS